MKFYNKLDCVVRSQRANSGKCREATEISIFIGPILVASKILGGRYTPEQGMAEFRRNSKSFTAHSGMEAAKSLKLVA